MKVMFVGRLFSGLADSLAGGDWRPAGVPAVYRLLEALADDPDIELLSVLTETDRHNPGVTGRNRHCHVPRIGTVIVLPFRRLTGGRLDTALTLAVHLFSCLWLYARHRPDVIYLTNANFVTAAVFARLGLGRVVLRLLGIVDQHRRLARGTGLTWRQRLERWLFRAPFDHVVCTEDGSDPGAVLARLLRPSVPCTIRLNGVDSPAPATADVGARPMVAFVGRLERRKGVDEFLAGALAFLDRRPDGADFLIVGDGPRLADIRAGAAASPRVQVTGGVPHQAVAAHLAAADIYVSLNRLGNLSNANLEALAAGRCLIFLGPDPEVPVDMVTQRLIPDSAAIRIARDRTPAALAEALCRLIDRPDEIAARQVAAAALAKTLLEPWPARIAREIAILTGAGEAPASPAMERVASGP